MKNTYKKLKLISHEDFKKKLLKKPSFRKYYEESSFEREIFKAIIIARARQKLSQRELAEKIGVKQSALARFESGRTNPTLGFLKKVVSGLGLSVTVK
ncbi:MAG: helix-turn-helix transcriptional regulator [Candidatus Zambryskibacteria bacterium]